MLRSRAETSRAARIPNGGSNLLTQLPRKGDSGGYPRAMQPRDRKSGSRRSDPSATKSTQDPKWGKRTPPKSERAAAAERLEADARRKDAGISRSSEALRATTPRILGEKSRFIGIDLGLATAFAIFNRDGRLESVRSRRFQSKNALRAAAASILDETPYVHSVIVEGGGDLAESWQKAAAHRGMHLRLVHAGEWRRMFLYEREQRDGAQAKAHALKLAAQVIEWSGTKGVTAQLGHDAAEAILVGLFGVIEAGWLKDAPRFRH